MWVIEPPNSDAPKCQARIDPPYAYPTRVRLKEACRRNLDLTGRTPTASATTTGEGSGEGERSALSPALELLRPHVFGFLRVAFSAESTMHLSSAGFSLAVELWMLWMRPWAAASILRGGGFVALVVVVVVIVVAASICVFLLLDG